jgi:hypothetical protein
VQLLEALKKRLETSGFLLIAVPNCRSFDARLFRENWVAYDAPRHLYHFRSTDMEEFLSQQGFEIVDYRRLNFDPWFNSLFSAVLQSRENKFWLISLGLLKSTFSAVISSLMGWININNHASIIYIAKPVSK